MTFFNPGCVADWTLCGPTDIACDSAALVSTTQSNDSIFKRKGNDMGACDDTYRSPNANASDARVTDRDPAPFVFSSMDNVEQNGPDDERQPKDEVHPANDDNHAPQMPLPYALPPLARPPPLTRADRNRTENTTMTTIATVTSTDSNSTYGFLDLGLGFYISQETMHHHMNSGIPINVYDDQNVINLAAAYANGGSPMEDIRDDNSDQRGGGGGGMTGDDLPAIISIPSALHQHRKPRPHHKRTKSKQQQAAIFVARPYMTDSNSSPRSAPKVVVDVSMGVDSEDVPFVECHEMMPSTPPLPPSVVINSDLLQATPIKDISSDHCSGNNHIHNHNDIPIRVAREQASLLDLPRVPTGAVDGGAMDTDEIVATVSDESDVQQKEQQQEQFQGETLPGVLPRAPSFIVTTDV